MAVAIGFTNRDFGIGQLNAVRGQRCHMHRTDVQPSDHMASFTDVSVLYLESETAIGSGGNLGYGFQFSLGNIQFFVKRLRVCNGGCGFIWKMAIIVLYLCNHSSNTVCSKELFLADIALAHCDPSTTCWKNVLRPHYGPQSSSELCFQTSGFLLNAGYSSRIVERSTGCIMCGMNG